MSGSWPVFAAASITVSLPVLVIFFLCQKHMILRADRRRCEGMRLDAVLHIPMSEYAHGLDENHIVFRLRCARSDLKRCTLYYGDTACRVTPRRFASSSWDSLAAFR